MPAERRHLVADRFARAGWKQHDRIATLDDMANHVALLPAEFGMAEDFVQDVMGAGAEVEQAQFASVSRGWPLIRQPPPVVIPAKAGTQGQDLRQ